MNPFDITKGNAVSEKAHGVESDNTKKSATNFPISAQPDQYAEIALDLGELTDAARDCFRNGSANNINELIEALRVDHVRQERSLESWIQILPMVREAATNAFNEAIDSGIVLPSKTHGWPKPKSVELHEFLVARSSPDCIVEEYLYADVALLLAPGGYGKTTLMLYEAACIAGGAESLYGRRILKSGPVVIITAEDNREQMIARLREIIFDNGMTFKQTKVLQNIRIMDVGGLGKKLTAVENDVVVMAQDIDELISSLSAIRPVLVIIDPAVSFGVGESRVNDAEQGLVEAARRLRNSIGCCVRYVHHTGKQNAREGAVDQYAGRGGSTFADGSRMVHVLANLNSSDWLKATGLDLKSDTYGLRLVPAKMSYCQKQPDVYIRRVGYQFAAVPAGINSETVIADMIYRRILTDFESGVRHSNSSIEQEEKLGSISRAQRRRAIEQLKGAGRLEPRTPPNGRGASKYLHPLPLASVECESCSDPAAFTGEKEVNSSPSTPLSPPPDASIPISPPHRVCSGGEIADHHYAPYALNLAATDGEMAARWRDNPSQVLTGQTTEGGWT